jgi:hypothetical protein
MSFFMPESGQLNNERDEHVPCAMTKVGRLSAIGNVFTKKLDAFPSTEHKRLLTTISQHLVTAIL